MKNCDICLPFVLPPLA